MEFVLLVAIILIYRYFTRWHRWGAVTNEKIELADRLSDIRLAEEEGLAEIRIQELDARDRLEIKQANRRRKFAIRAAQDFPGFDDLFDQNGNPLFTYDGPGYPTEAEALAAQRHGPDGDLRGCTFPMGPLTQD